MKILCESGNASLSPHLDERVGVFLRRAKPKAAGYGGIAAVSRITDVRRVRSAGA